MSFREVMPGDNRWPAFDSLLLKEELLWRLVLTTERWAWGHSTFSISPPLRSTFWIVIIYLSTFPCILFILPVVFAVIYTQNISFCQGSSEKLLLSRLCTFNTFHLLFYPHEQWYIQHHLFVLILVYVFALTHVSSIQCPIEKIHRVFLRLQRCI